MSELLEETLGIHFHDPALLQLALTHRSYIYRSHGEGQCSNERLEFLGNLSWLLSVQIFFIVPFLI